MYKNDRKEEGHHEMKLQRDFIEIVRVVYKQQSYRNDKK